MTRRVKFLGMAIALIAAGAVQAEQTLESVENDVEALWAKINAFSAKVTSDTNVAMGPLSVKSRATGTLECLKQGDVSLFRLDLVNKMDTGIPLAGAMEQKMLSVYDGKEMISEMEMMGKRQAIRMPSDSARKQGPASGKSMFATFRKQGDVKLLPDAAVDGKPAYVVEVTPNDAMKKGAPTPVGLIKYYISKEYGLQIKTEVFNEEGEPTSTTVYNDIDTTAKLTPERFVYTAPPGVTIQDMSSLGLPGK